MPEDDNKFNQIHSLPQQEGRLSELAREAVKTSEAFLLKFDNEIIPQMEELATRLKTALDLDEKDQEAAWNQIIPEMAIPYLNGLLTYFRNQLFPHLPSNRPDE